MNLFYWLRLFEIKRNLEYTHPWAKNKTHAPHCDPARFAKLWIISRETCLFGGDSVS